MDGVNFESVGRVVKKSRYATFVEVDAGDVKKALTKLRLSGVSRLQTITGVDNGSEIEVIYHLDKDYHMINLRTRIARNGSKIDSVTTIYSAAKLYERELSEMLDIQIEGNREPKNVFLTNESPRAPLKKV